MLSGEAVDVTYRAVVVAQSPPEPIAPHLVCDLTHLDGAALLGASAAAIAAGRRVLRVREEELRAARRVATTMAAILEARST
jgi:hypothetical protein